MNLDKPTHEDIDKLCNLAREITGSYQPEDWEGEREWIEAMRTKLKLMSNRLTRATRKNARIRVQQKDKVTSA